MGLETEHHLARPLQPRGGEGGSRFSSRPGPVTFSEASQRPIAPDGVPLRWMNQHSPSQGCHLGPLGKLSHRDRVPSTSLHKPGCVAFFQLLFLGQGGDGSVCVCVCVCSARSPQKKNMAVEREGAQGPREAEDNQWIRASGPGSKKNILPVYKRGKKKKKHLQK